MEETFNPTYYATVAQVIPILLIVLFVEGWRRDRIEKPGPAGPFLLATLALLVGGEAIALKVLDQRETATFTDNAVISGALIWSGMVIVVWVTGPLLSSVTATRAGRWGVSAYFIGLAAALLLLMVGVLDFSSLVAYAALAAVALAVLPGVIGDTLRDARRAAPAPPNSGD